MRPEGRPPRVYWRHVQDHPGPRSVGDRSRGGGHGRGSNRRGRRGVAHLRRRSRPYPLCAARSDRRRQLRRSRGGLAVQDRQSRPGAGVPLPVDAAGGRRRDVHDRRVAQGGGVARRGDRRDALDVQPRRGCARRRGAAAVVRPRARVLGSRGRAAPGRLRHARLPADCARRGHRSARARVRDTRHGRPEAGGRSAHRSGHRRDRPARDADRRGRRHHRRAPRTAPAATRAAAPT